MKIGDIDVTNSILNLEHDINVIQQVLNHLLINNKDLIKPTPEDIELFKQNAINNLKEKYPSMGISKK